MGRWVGRSRYQLFWHAFISPPHSDLSLASSGGRQPPGRLEVITTLLSATSTNKRLPNSSHVKGYHGKHGPICDSVSGCFTLPDTHNLNSRYKGLKGTMKFRYPCELPCKARWNKPGPLNRHQKTCEHWRAYEIKMLNLRAKSALEPPRKRRKKSHKEVRHLIHSTR